MRHALHTATLTVASSLTTALLFAACGVVNQPSPPPDATTAPPQADVIGSPAAAGSPSAAPSQAAVPGLTAPVVTTAPVSAQVPPAAPTSRNPATQVYIRNGASVVNITSLAAVRTRQGNTTQPRGIGSGFIIDTDGRIVTNNHVVQDADQLTVTFQDRTTVPAKLLGRDPDNDLAVVQVDAGSNDDDGKPIRDRLKPVALGDSDKLMVGEDTIAIGSPLGLQQTVTAGIVSALRNPGEDATGQGGLDLLGGAVQTDASINPGNSGGPLFNAAGEVIGVNTAILSQSGGNEGIGFAIPVNVVKRVAPILIQTGRYPHPLIGVSTLGLATLSQAARQQLGVAANQRGLLVQDVSAGASTAGIQGGSRTVSVNGEQVRTGGDVIVAVDGHAVNASGELRGYIENNKKPGDTVTLTVVRNGQRQDLSVKLTEKPPEEANR